MQLEVSCESKELTSKVPVAIEDLVVMRFPSELLLCKKNFIRPVPNCAYKPVWWKKNASSTMLLMIKNKQSMYKSSKKKVTPCKLKIDPENLPYQKERIIFHLSLFSGCVKTSGRVHWHIITILETHEMNAFPFSYRDLLRFCFWGVDFATSQQP